MKEGYGEEVVNAQKQETFIRLKEKAKALMGPHCTQPSDILNVLDEICKEGDRLQDEARREKHDLQQQVTSILASSPAGNYSNRQLTSGFTRFFCLI